MYPPERKTRASVEIGFAIARDEKVSSPQTSILELDRHFQFERHPEPGQIIRAATYIANVWSRPVRMPMCGKREREREDIVQRKPKRSREHDEADG